MKPHNVSIPSDLMDLPTVCAYLGKSRPFIYRAMRTQGLPAIRMGSRWNFSKAQVDAWIKALPGVNLPTAS